mmetsp:Transcript_29811/g.76549  ORF Transcript_29811/g.76549 Transcript_29811/m.76549 type:complete len:273 (+) Transcript_29811:625-1443(+)
MPGYSAVQLHGPGELCHGRGRGHDNAKKSTGNHLRRAEHPHLWRVAQRPHRGQHRRWRQALRQLRPLHVGGEPQRCVLLRLPGVVRGEHPERLPFVQVLCWARRQWREHPALLSPDHPVLQRQRRLGTCHGPHARGLARVDFGGPGASSAKFCDQPSCGEDWPAVQPHHPRGRITVPPHQDDGCLPPSACEAGGCRAALHRPGADGSVGIVVLGVDAQGSAHEPGQPLRSPRADYPHHLLPEARRFHRRDGALRRLPPLRSSAGPELRGVLL